MDWRNPADLGLTRDDLCDDADLEVPRALAEAALARGVEGMLVPSATLLGDNLIVLTGNRRPGTSFEIVGFIEPRLYRESGG
jgi:hypothetical protein